MGRFLILTLILAACSCGYLSPHDNFKAHMSSTVGKRISDPHTWARDDRYVSKRALRNGNQEFKYVLRQNCWYFFEVEKNTQVIIGWRFEGNEKSCVIAP